MAVPLLIRPKFIVVDRGKFTATLWRLRRGTHEREKRYDVAVGADGFRTPAGVYFIVRKEKDPPWLPPDSSWVGDNLRDPVTHKPVVIPGGDERNPLRGAGLWFSGKAAIGFHGIPEYEYDTIGKAASHGCMRMRVPDVLDLYRRVWRGTPVHVV